MAKHTISTLTKDLEGFKRYVRGEFKELRPKVEAMHEFIIDNQGFERGRATVKKDGSINIDPRAFDVIKWLALAVLCAVGGAKFL